MKTREIVDGLRLFNDWLIGDEMEQPDPKGIVIWIEMAASRLNELEVALDRSTAYLDELNNDSKNMTIKNQLDQNYKLLKGE